MRALEIRSFARLHFGLLQMSAAYKRRNMGIGVALDAPRWCLRIERLHWQEGIVFEAPPCAVPPEFAETARAMVQRFQEHGPSRLGLRVEVVESIPTHVGLGSTTAFLRALWAACGLLVSGKHTMLPIQAIGRGGTSGIGVNLGDSGGVVVDAGHIWSKDAVMDTSRMRVGAPVPKVLGRYAIPDGALLLARMRGEEGPSGPAESKIFHQVLPIEQDEVNRVAATVLFEALPALAYENWTDFGHALERLQRIGFKKKEWEVQTENTKRLATIGYQAGACCAALSSMGPTVAIIAHDLDAVRQRLLEVFGNAVITVRSRVRNLGMEWKIIE